MKTCNERDVLVIGAGPAGLSAAWQLCEYGLSPLVLEQLNQVGGISMTREYKGYRFDLGGHRFFSKSARVRDFWHGLLGSEFLLCGRISRIFFRGKYFSYPLKLGEVVRTLGAVYSGYLGISYFKAKLFPRRNVVSFEDWVVNQFGQGLYRTFFKTYTEKVWGMPCEQISADWAAQRIRGLSVMKILRSVMPYSRGQDEIITTLIEQFHYPRLGPGQMWECCAGSILKAGGELRIGQRVSSIFLSKDGVFEVTAEHRGGGSESYRSRKLISSMPIRSLVRVLRNEIPDEIRSAAERLTYRDFLIVVLIINRQELFTDNWLYIHDPGVKVGRIQNFKNWSPDMVPSRGVTSLGMEYFCHVGDNLWSMGDEKLVQLATAELGQIGFEAEVVDSTVIRVPKAYPVYDDCYSDAVGKIRDYFSSEMPGLQLVGRNGMHRYNNQDHSIMTGMLAADNIAAKGNFDLWLVNGDAEYLEEGSGEDPMDRLTPKRISEV